MEVSRIYTHSSFSVGSPWDARDRQLLRTLGHPTLSTTQTLVISECESPTSAEVEECPIFQALSSTNNLRTLILIDCHNLPYILQLDPERHPSNLVLCPNIEELVLYVNSWSKVDAGPLIRMAKNRASRRARLSSIKLVCRSGQGQREREVSELKEHVTHVEYRVDEVIPAWDDVPGRCGEESE